MNDNNTYFLMLKKIKAFRTRKKAIAVLNGLLEFFIFAIPAWFIVLILNMIFPIYHQYLLLAVLCFTFLVAMPKIVLPFFKFLFLVNVPSINTCAQEIGAHFENVNDRLVNALQLVQNAERDQNRISIQLVDAALQQMTLQFDKVDFTKIVDKKSLFIKSQLLLPLLIVFIAIFVLFPVQSHFSVKTLFHPFQNYSEQPFVQFTVFPGDTLALKDSDLPIKIWTSDSTAESILLHTEQKNIKKQVELFRAQDDTFRHTLQALRDSMVYFCEINEQQSNTFHIHVVDPPFIKKIRVKLTPPAYSGISAFMLDENVAHIQALKGTKVHITAFTNKSIQTAKLITNQHGHHDVHVQSNRLTVTLQIHSDDEYYFQLTDHFGYENPSPIHYSIKIRPDQFPYVRIIDPGKDIDLPEDMIISLAFEAEDDYGLSKLELGSQVLFQGAELDSLSFSFQELSGFSPDDDFVRLGMNWDISSAEMYPTDVLAYFIRVYDNDVMSGPKYSDSQIYYARFPSLYEMYEEMTMQQDDAIEEMEQVLEKSKEIEEKLEELNRELERNPEMDWEKKQEIQDAINNQKEIQEQVSKTAEQLEEMLQKMEENDMLSEETLEKYKELQQLYKDVLTPEMQQNMEKINQAMENIDEQKLHEAMKNFKLDEEAFNKKLERNINLLKKFKAEQKLDQALKMTQDLQERQDKISKNMQEPLADLERLAKEEQRMQKDAESLENLLQELQQDMDELASLPKEPVEQAHEQMQQDQLLQKLQNMANQLEQNQTQSFQQQSDQAKQTLEQMQESLQQAMQMMNNSNQMQMMQAMRKTGRQLLQLSQQQEQLQKQTAEMGKNDPSLTKSAEQQQQLSSALDRVLDELYGEMNKSAGVDSKISESLGKASEQMDNAIRSMEERNNNSAAKQQEQAMAQLNDAARQVQQSMQNMMQQQSSGNGSMSYQQFMQQMQKLANSQQQINQESLQMAMMQGMAQQQMMSKLGQQQGLVRKSMQQLAQEAGNSEELLGSMEKITEEMEKVEKDFQNQQVSRETIERQNRILSRMLDAQRSIRQREYSRERQAESGREYTTKSPKELANNPGERENQLKQDLLRAKKEGYSADYLQMIEKYFEVLSENED